MPQCLISVTSVEEAEIALNHGADIIDLKDPSSGALGALTIESISEITKFINARKLVSATVGDLPMQAEIIANAVRKVSLCNVDFIKIGFFESANYSDCLTALSPIVEDGVKLIAVLFAENKYPLSLIDTIKDAGFIGVMLDTAEKNGLTLFDHFTKSQCEEFCEYVIGLNLSLGLAGSLNKAHIEMAKALKPSYVGFRGGVCEGNSRTSTLSASKVSELCKLL